MLFTRIIIFLLSCEFEHSHKAHVRCKPMIGHGVLLQKHVNSLMSWIVVCKHSKERAKHRTAELRLDALLSETEAEGGGGGGRVARSCHRNKRSPL